MNRRIAMLSLFGSLTAALGCHIGGKSDYGAHPADAVIPQPTAPYAAAPAPVGRAAPLEIPPIDKGKVKVPNE